MAEHLTDEVIQRITANAVAIALRQDREERDRQSRLATEAAVSAALANQTNQVRALRKPELPNFDKNNVHTWIRRTEAAFRRSDIHNTRDKFAFLETKFHIDADPKVNELLEGQTDADWTAFLDYLREIHGRTKKQEVYSLLNGTPRDGRRPTALAVKINEQAGKITLDDIKKEVFLKEMPVEIQQHAEPRIKGLDFMETAKVMDDYFDQKGKLLHSSKNASSINSINNSSKQTTSRPRQSAMKPAESQWRPPSTSPTRSSEAPTFTTTFSDDADTTDVNAVRFRQNGQRQQFNVSNRSQSRGRPRDSGGSNNNGRSSFSSSNNNARSENGRSQSRFRNSSSVKPKNKVCFYHNQHGNDANKCEEGCILWPQHLAKGRASH